MEIFVLFLLGSLQVGSALDIMACNCSQAEIVGLMDIQQPSYCDERLMQQKPVPTKYAFFITEEPHSTWKGNLCMTWLKEKNITGFFFGGFDTTTALNIQKVSVRECREIIETHDCSGNKMEQIVRTCTLTKPNRLEKAHGCNRKNILYGIVLSSR